MSAFAGMLRTLFAGSGWRLTLLAGIIYLVGLYSLVLPLLLALAIDVLLPQGLATHLIAVVVAAILLAMLRFCLAFVQDYEFLRLRLRSEGTLLQQILASMLNDVSAVEGPKGKGGISQWMRIWLVNFQYQMTEILFFCAYAVLISLTVLAVIFWVDVQIGLIVLAFAALHYANFRYHNPKSRLHSQTYSDAKTAFMRDATTAIGAKRAINVSQLDEVIGADLHAKARLAFGAGRDRALVAASQGSVQSMLRGGLYLLLIAFCAPRIVIGEMTVGALLFVLLLVSFAYEPVYRLNQITTMANQMLANYEPLRVFLSREKRAQQILAGGDRTEEGLEITSVRCSIDGEALFKPVSMNLPFGQTCLITGPSGVGKSTLLDVIAGLSEPDAGEIEWAGSAMGNHRHRIFIARQHTQVFRASVADNISLFDPAADKERIGQLLREVGLLELARNVDNITSDASLSLGERQRIGLARALYQAPSLLLLDEPTANLDRATENQCLDAISAGARERITVLVSHSSEARRIADTTVKIERSDAV